MTDEYEPLKDSQHKFVWNDKLNSFSKRAKPPLTGSSNQDSVILQTMEEIESKSGIKRRSTLFWCFKLIIVVLIGYTIGFLLILYERSFLGGAVIIATALISFFTIVGYEITRGNQVTRSNKWMEKNKDRINQSLRPYGVTMFYSFTRSKLNS